MRWGFPCARALVALSSLCAACTTTVETPTQVLVLVDAESRVAEATEALHIVVESRSGRGELLNMRVEPKWPLKLAIVPDGGDASRSYLVTVEALQGDGVIARSRLLSGFVDGERRYVYLLLEDDCLGRPDQCGGDTTCHAGGCVSALIQARDFGTSIGNAPRAGDIAEPASGPPADDRDAAGPDATPNEGGTADAGGDGGKPPPEPDPGDRADGEPCDGAGECESGSCVAGVCCAQACDAPGTCEAAEGATCSGGSTCVYPQAEDGTDCDDGDPCTGEAECASGACERVSDVDCDDDNACTVDACDAELGCVHDGTGVFTPGCGEDDACGQGYRCAGDEQGNCIAEQPTDCSASGAECVEARCDPVTGCYGVELDGVGCEDGDSCTTGDTCVEGVCQTGGGELDCDMSTSDCTTARCEPASGCVVVNTTDTCDDQDACTDEDRCAGGECKGRSIDCSGLDDQCNAGVCSGGTCVKEAGNEDAPCNDSNSCTAGETCGGGSCSSGNNACGQHATQCQPGSPNQCTCAAQYEDNGAGQCVPNVDECAGGCGAAACSANANCVDSSPSCGDRSCTCKPGFSGSGTVCNDIDECAGNPCGAGRGTCTQPAPGTYACSCGAGFMRVDTPTGPTCVCNMNGAFAVKASVVFSWPATPLAEGNIEAGSATVSVWSLRRQTYAADGTLTTEIIGCGSTPLVQCGLGISILGVPAESYASYYPVHIWDQAGMPHDMETPFALPRPIVGSAFVTPMVTNLLGIRLTSPSGTWPSSRSQVGGASPANGAAWLDHDGDGLVGVTSHWVPPGGIAPDGTPPDPPGTYAVKAPECPRGNAGAARLPYTYQPIIEGTTVRRVIRVQGASRIMSWLEGEVDSCDRIHGDIKGPDGGQIQTDLRVAGCVRANGTGEAACASTGVDLQDAIQPLPVSGATFVMRRLPEPATCAQVRATTF